MGKKICCSIIYNVEKIYNSKWMFMVTVPIFINIFSMLP